MKTVIPRNGGQPIRVTPRQARQLVWKEKTHKYCMKSKWKKEVRDRKGFPSNT